VKWRCEMSKFSDSQGSISFKQDGKDGGHRQDSYTKGDGGGHEHMWSKTADGQHKEGWHGSKAQTSGNKPSGGSGK